MSLDPPAHVLVADDDPKELLTMARLLKGEGHTVMTVQSAPEVLRYLSTNCADLWYLMFTYRAMGTSE